MKKKLTGDKVEVALRKLEREKWWWKRFALCRELPKVTNDPLSNIGRTKVRKEGLKFFLQFLQDRDNQIKIRRILRAFLPYGEELNEVLIEEFTHDDLYVTFVTVFNERLRKSACFHEIHLRHDESYSLGKPWIHLPLESILQLEKVLPYSSHKWEKAISIKGKPSGSNWWHFESVSVNLEFLDSAISSELESLLVSIRKKTRIKGISKRVNNPVVPYSFRYAEEFDKKVTGLKYVSNWITKGKKKLQSDLSLIN
jgi:hypothetical protein